jgi:GntR family transcriptional repressor for pyruvate dehydrogenase complex
VVKRQTITSQVINHILNLIKVEGLKPGDRLPTEKQFIESLGVSRTCVREAVKSLESLGVISIRPKVGAILLEPWSGALFSAERMSAIVNQEQVDELFEFRKILEVGFVTLAAERARDEDLSAMREAMEEHEAALQTPEKASYMADVNFHTAIARAARNQVALDIYNLILGPLVEQRKSTNKVTSSAEESLPEHRKIYRAIEEMNPERARLAMIAHMKSAERHLRIAMAQKLTEAVAPIGRKKLPPEDAKPDGWTVPTDA